MFSDWICECGHHYLNHTPPFPPEEKGRGSCIMKKLDKIFVGVKDCGCKRFFKRDELDELILKLRKDKEEK